MSAHENYQAVPLVLVVGAGQAGLAMGYRLRQRHIPFRIIEAGGRIGDNWRKRYASLTLFTPRWFSALPDLALSGDPEGYASRDEFADYLEHYARVHQLPVETRKRVGRLTRAPGGVFTAALADGEVILAKAVVVATGGFQRAIVPDVATGFASEVIQLTGDAYREPSQIRPGTVLVVGDGATGRDIAAELSIGHRVLLATGKPRRLFPERVLGRSIWWWLSRLGLMNAAADSFIGRRMRQADPFPDRDRSLVSLERRAVVARTRLVSASGRIASFNDGHAEDVATVIWATGYRDETEWVAIPEAVDTKGGFRQRYGISPVPGLFFVGRPWQRNRASGLIIGAGDDAAVIAREVVSYLQQPAQWSQFVVP